MKRTAIIACAAITTLTGCSFNVFKDPTAPSFVKTCSTGNESQVLEQYRLAAQPPQTVQTAQTDADNCLDEAFDVLMDRAYPSCDPRTLARSTVDELCGEYRRQCGVAISSAHREAWIWKAIRTQSFSDVLGQLAQRRPVAHNKEKLIAAGLRGMLRGAGPSSGQLFSPAVADALDKSKVQKRKPEAGVVGLATDNWPAIDVLPLSPAHQAGLRDGDVITAINGQPAGPRDSEQAIGAALAGPVGSTLQITAKRDNVARTFRVRRTSAASLDVRAAVPQQGLCYIRIPSFAGSGVGSKVATLARRAQSAGIGKFILDLRGNSGGRLEEANAVADIFLDKRTLQTFAFRVGQRIVFLSKPGAMPAEVTILTNRGTASAAEMLAMALRDNGKAVIVGEDTFGALFGRDQHRLSNGYAISFRAELTILSPRGDDYSVTGIYPDIAVEDSRNQQKDTILARAIRSAATAGNQPKYANVSQDSDKQED